MTVATYDFLRKVWQVMLAASLFIGPAHSEAPIATQVQCVHLGGALPCKPALTTQWIYHADGKTYPDEAAAYADMLQTHAPGSVFSLTQRWGAGDRASQALPARYDRSFEVSSWKLFLHCIPREANGPCEPQLGYPGYMRVRTVICPPGYLFSSDAGSPYCLQSAGATVQAPLVQTPGGPGPFTVSAPSRLASVHLPAAALRLPR